MPLAIVTADERLAEANAKTTMTIFGPPGVGKTSLLKTTPAEPTLCIDVEAGLKSVQDWRGDSIPIRTCEGFRMPAGREVAGSAEGRRPKASREDAMGR